MNAPHLRSSPRTRGPRRRKSAGADEAPKESARLPAPGPRYDMLGPRVRGDERLKRLRAIEIRKGHLTHPTLSLQNNM
jgi:hypothetical protein